MRFAKSTADAANTLDVDPFRSAQIEAITKMKTALAMMSQGSAEETLNIYESAG